jgi:hypothetical protein
MGRVGQIVQGGVALIVLAGGAGGIYIINHPNLEHKLIPATKPATIPTPPANAPVGFNASKTAFVLPHHLGYLPGPDLALAKINPSYAAGLANSSDWKKLYNHLYYAPPVSNALSAPIPYKHLKQEIIGNLYSVRAMGTVGDEQMTTKTHVANQTLHRLHFMDTTLSAQEYVVPSLLEIEAAPVGQTTVTLNTQSAFCVPSPVAFINSGSVFTPSQISTITAGPAAVFSANNNGLMWDQGSSSCAGFS